MTVQLQRRHLELFASVIRDYNRGQPVVEQMRIAYCFADRLEKFNPNFKYDLFIQHCINEGVITHGKGSKREQVAHHRQAEHPSYVDAA